MDQENISNYLLFFFFFFLSSRGCHQQRDIWHCTMWCWLSFRNHIWRLDGKALCKGSANAIAEELRPSNSIQCVVHESRVLLFAMIGSYNHDSLGGGGTY